MSDPQWDFYLGAWAGGVVGVMLGAVVMRAHLAIQDWLATRVKARNMRRNMWTQMGRAFPYVVAGTLAVVALMWSAAK